MEEDSLSKGISGIKVPPKDESYKLLCMWEEVRTLGKHPGRRSYHTAVMWEDKMLVYGGQDLSEGPYGDLWSVEIGQFGQESWQQITIEDKGCISRHSAIVKNDKMYVFGGTNGVEEFSKTLVLSLNSMTWKEHLSQDNLPPPLDSHTSCLYDSEQGPLMVVFGGYSHGERTNQVYILQLDTMKWSKFETSSKQPEIRSSHSASVYNHCLYIFGGISDEGEKLNDFWKLDLKTRIWIQITGSGELPVGRSGHTSVVYKDFLIIFGGMKDITKETNDLHSYHFQSSSWTNFQYEYQVRDPVSPDQLEEYKKNKASLAAMKDKKFSTEPSPNRSPVRRPTFMDSSRGSPARRQTVEGDGTPQYRRRRTLYEGPMSPLEGRIKGRLPHPRDGHSTVINGDIMIVFGGDRHQMPFNDTYVYYLVEENIKSPARLDNS